MCTTRLDTARHHDPSLRMIDRHEMCMFFVQACQRAIVHLLYFAKQPAMDETMRGKSSSIMDRVFWAPWRVMVASKPACLVAPAVPASLRQYNCCERTPVHSQPHSHYPAHTINTPQLNTPHPPWAPTARRPHPPPQTSWYTSHPATAVPASTPHVHAPHL